MRWALSSGVIGLAASLLCAPAGAQVTVFGDSFAATCSRAARDGRMDASAIQLCTVALGEAPLSRHDVAATYVNRATMYQHRREWSAALADLNAALAIDDRIGEARVNRGAVYIATGRAKDAVGEIDAGLELRSEQPEKAYYNRAIAHEMLDDVKSAYFDYVKAAELAPKWTEPKEALTRFKVSTRQ